MGCGVSSQVAPEETCWEKIVEIVNEGGQVPLAPFRKCPDRPDWTNPILDSMIYDFKVLWFPDPATRPATAEQHKLGMVIPPSSQKKIKDRINLVSN